MFDWLQVQLFYSKYLLNKDINNQKISLYFVGRLTFQKNIITLINYFSFLYKDDPNISLTIIGDGELNKVVKEYSNISNIFFLYLGY